MFRLGVSSGHITELTVAPRRIQLGEPVKIDMTFSNIGTVDISGVAHIMVQNELGDLIAEFTHNLSELAPSESAGISHTWIVSDIQASRIIAYVSYDSKTTDMLRVDIARSRR